MFGFVGSVTFNESSIWNYASVILFEEAGCSLKTWRGKVFTKDLIEVSKQLKLGDQVAFNIKATSRGNRNYIEFTDLKKQQFTLCNKCGLTVHGFKDCIVDLSSDRLHGIFKVIKCDSEEHGTKMVLKQDDLQFTYIQWNNSPFVTDFKEGDHVFVNGWRSAERVSTLRELYKSEIPHNS